MLKAALVLGLVAFAALPALADEAAHLVVGSVRDGRGAPVADAEIVALGADGAPAGRDRSDAVGTFAVALARPAQTLEVRCRHCRTLRANLPLDGTNVAIVVTRYAALESGVPDAADLAALPYGAPGDALGLVPFTLNAGGTISDRGLGGGRGLVLGDGAPLVDKALGTSGLAYFPDRYVRDIAVVGPERAYRYGLDAGGGVFALDQLETGVTSASADAGRSSSLALQPSFGDAYPAAGISSDGSSLVRRADADYAGPFAGGFLRAGFGASGASYGSPELPATATDASSLRAAYATASRTYRTFVNLSATDAAYDAGANGSYRSGYLDASLRVERPGPMTIAAGANVERITSAWLAAAMYPYSARAFDATAYIDARAGGERANFEAGLGAFDLSDGADVGRGTVAASHLALLPSLVARSALGGALYVRGGYSESARLPSLAEIGALAPETAPPLERAELTEGALGYDAGGRVRAEAIAYREFTHGYDERRLDGLGFSFVWQVAPFVSVRAWSLRASPLAFAAPFAAESDASRQVLWSTYANGDGLRIDAIFHRDVVAGSRAYAFDASSYVPLFDRVALAAGSTERGGARRYYVGVRLR